ncbi:MAG: phage tail protein [Lachnospiraceae bacterium]|nr:phage tail protein [Lachnospiraceae bacterium]
MPAGSINTSVGPYDNGQGLAYPLTKMNFYVSVNNVEGGAAFNQVTGLDAAVDVIEFRQGNAHSLSPVKLPGLVKHGNVTLRFGYTIDNMFKTWIQECVSERRGQMPRNDVTIELIDINGGAPQTISTAVTGTRVWVLSNAWVTHYTGPELDAASSDVAIESVEIAFEEMVIPN